MFAGPRTPTTLSRLVRGRWSWKDLRQGYGGSEGLKPVLVCTGRNSLRISINVRHQERQIKSQVNQGSFDWERHTPVGTQLHCTRCKGRGRGDYRPRHSSTHLLEDGVPLPNRRPETSHVVTLQAQRHQDRGSSGLLVVFTSSRGLLAFVCSVGVVSSTGGPSGHHRRIDGPRPTPANWTTVPGVRHYQTSLPG